MTPTAEVLKKEHPDKKEYWQNELHSLGVEPKQENELNDREELETWQTLSNRQCFRIIK